MDQTAVARATSTGSKGGGVEGGEQEAMNGEYLMIWVD
jgi:hypothetical protein